MLLKCQDCETINAKEETQNKIGIGLLSGVQLPPKQQTCISCGSAKLKEIEDELPF